MTTCAALRAHRQAALPGLRRADHRSRRRSRSSTASWRCPRAPAFRCSPRSSAAQGRVRRPVRRAADEGLRARPHRRHVHPLTEPPKLKKQEKHTIEAVVDRLSAKPSSKQRITDSIETALGPGRRRGHPRLRRPGPRTTAAPRAALFRAAGLPQRPPAGHRRARTALVLVQRPVRRLPGLHRPRHPARGRPRTRRPRPRADAWPVGAIAAVVGGHTSEYFLRLLQGVWPTRSASISTPRGSGCPLARRRRSCTARATRCTSATSNRYGRDRSVLRRLRGRRPVDRAAPHRDRQRLLAREVRGLHA